MIRFAFAVIVGFLAETGAATAQPVVNPFDDIAGGRRLALNVCAACHVVLADQQPKPILQPPATDFRRIANKPDTTATSLTQFLNATHPNATGSVEMPNPRLDEGQVKRVVAFILSLRATHPAPGKASSRAGNVATGYRLAASLCSGCHLIGQTGEGPWTDAPSFPVIANRQQTTMQSLETVIEAPHIDMLNLGRNSTEAADISAYILSLRQP